jgi:hypothetical protein
LNRSLRETMDRRATYLALQNVMDRWVLKHKHTHTHTHTHTHCSVLYCSFAKSPRS